MNHIKNWYGIRKLEKKKNYLFILKKMVEKMIVIDKTITDDDELQLTHLTISGNGTMSTDF